MTIMKKAYKTPAVKVANFNSEALLLTQSDTLAPNGAVGLSRERGTRQKSETIFDEELW